MLKNLIVLQDGTELCSGVGTKNAVMGATLTECVNVGEDLTLGSTCANMLEATIWNPGGSLSLKTGEELTLYKLGDTGTRKKVGVFSLEKPTRPSTNTLRITGYDRVAKLDKDLTTWLKALDGWPYPLLDFAKMVCNACGLTLVTESIPNAAFPVNRISKSEVTGRQLMQWVGEACCRFCRANADGNIELAWYTPSGVSIAPTGDDFYYANSLTYEDYEVAPIEAVQLKLADSENGYLWPEAVEDANSYIITGNPLFDAVTGDVLTCLQEVQKELTSFTYRPCKVSFPAREDVRAGNTVEITDRNGVSFTACVMTKTQKGQRDTIESTGSARRDSTTAQNNGRDTPLTQGEIFEILTNGGEIEGLFMKDGKLYINATYIAAGILKGITVKACTITNEDGSVSMDLTDDGDMPVFNTGISTNGLYVRSPGDRRDLFSAEAIPCIVNDETIGHSARVILRDSSGMRPLIHMGESYRLNDSMDGIDFDGVYARLESDTHRVYLDILNDEMSIEFIAHDETVAAFAVDSSGISGLTIHKINGKTIEWNDNGDGTFALIGR